MIRGYFSTTGATRRPFMFAFLQFPALNDRFFDVEFLVDTGADRIAASLLQNKHETDKAAG